MKFSPWLIVTIILGYICWGITAVSGEAPELATEVSVHTSKVIKTTLHRYISAYGMIEPEPARNGKSSASSKIAAPMAGLLMQIYCEEGQQVKKGDLLFELDTRSSDALIAKAEVAVEFAQKNFARKQQLNITDNISRKLYDEGEQLLQTARKDLISAKTQRELLQIKAPLSGTVAVIYFKVGEMINLATVLADVINLNRLNIAIRVPSPEATDIRLGQSVAITVGSSPVTAPMNAPPIQRGTVTFISSQIDPLTDTVLVRTSLNAYVGLRSGQFVSVRLLVEKRPDRFAVPVESVVSNDGGSVIAVVEGDRAKQKIIKRGLRDGNLIEIEGDDLRDGMTIVTQGMYGLPPETRIRVIK
ncbi:efflux RND transporter periplasmic adaptor subunit [Methylobacter sp. S3L5C]|uniref:efflux RND transporter periplasmic adaptor subunit n=1 Tax=Methylobacter sp. S3L5C TaxID=2839024 RepID=UPI001FACE5F3|nr:efflux RND transporter periplasmic adaptor subunit [Methylobacter sp. S3L5C]UOA07275.1 efflux RND transporter periplasmic adaptor subunit [Methylobacter sp. S3L5C]